MNRSVPHRPRSSAARRSETPLNWLSHDTRGAGVLATARMHLQIQHVVCSVLPPALRSVCVVSKLEPPRVQLAVPSAAHAAKLRQLAPRMAEALTTQGWNINEIAVRVQAGLPRPGTKAPRPPKEAELLGTTALNAFEALRENLRPGPLADAVARLLAHHKES